MCNVPSIAVFCSKSIECFPGIIIVVVVLKSGSLNLLEPSGPVQACNGIALPLPLPFTPKRPIKCYLFTFTLHAPDVMSRHRRSVTSTLYSIVSYSFIASCFGLLYTAESSLHLAVPVTDCPNFLKSVTLHL